MVDPLRRASQFQQHKSHPSPHTHNPILRRSAASASVDRIEFTLRLLLIQPPKVCAISLSLCYANICLCPVLLISIISSAVVCFLAPQIQNSRTLYSPLPPIRPPGLSLIVTRGACPLVSRGWMFLVHLGVVCIRTRCDCTYLTVLRHLVCSSAPGIVSHHYHISSTASCVRQANG